MYQFLHDYLARAEISFFLLENRFTSDVWSRQGFWCNGRACPFLIVSGFLSLLVRQLFANELSSEWARTRISPGMGNW
jgi:hypothetical protein